MDIELERFLPCPSCRFDNKEDAISCGKCRIVFSEYNATQPPRGSAQPPVAQPPRERPQRPVASKEPRLSPVSLKSGAIVACILAIAAYLSYSSSYERVGASPGPGVVGVVFMHPKGSTADEWVPFAEEIAARAPNVAIYVAKAPHGHVTGRAWIVGGNSESEAKQSLKSRERILDAVADLENAGVASGDIYLAGFSQGADIALDVATGEPADRELGGLILLSGQQPSWRDGWADAFATDNFNDSFRVLITRGTADGVIPLAPPGQDIMTMLKPYANVEYLQFRGAHEVNHEVKDAVVEFLNP